MMYAMYMRTIDSSEETQSQLIIADSATKEEVLNFIETNWSSIKPHATSRVRGRPYADRDDEIYELAKTLSAREIQSKFAGRGFDLSEPHIRKIIERERKRRDT